MFFRHLIRTYLVGIPANPSAKKELIAAYREILDKAAHLNSFYGQSLQTIYQEKLNNLPVEMENALVAARDELSLIDHLGSE